MTDEAATGGGHLWMRPVPTRGRQPAHSRDGIAEAAVGIADAEGIHAMSMRHVAAAIDARATSLYRYVRSKDELLDLVVDRVMGEIDLPAPAGDWRRDLLAIAHAMRVVLLRHPWMIPIALLRPALGPHSLAVLEATLAALDGHGLSADATLGIANAFTTFVRGYAAGEIAEAQAEKRPDQQHDRWMAEQQAYIATVRRSGRYPSFMRIVDEARTPHDPTLIREGFERGLGYLLDGVATRLVQPAR